MCKDVARSPWHSVVTADSSLSGFCECFVCLTGNRLNGLETLRQRKGSDGGVNGERKVVSRTKVNAVHYVAE